MTDSAESERGNGSVSLPWWHEELIERSFLCLLGPFRDENCPSVLQIPVSAGGRFNAHGCRRKVQVTAEPTDVCTDPYNP